MGFVTSGGYGHSVGMSLALGYVDRACAQVGTELDVHVVGKRTPARVIADSPHDPAGARPRAPSGGDLMFRNDMPYVEVLSPEAIEIIEGGWRRLVSEIGIEFMHDEALDLLREAGQRVDGEVVHFDPDWVLEQVAQAPSEFHLRARDPQHSVTIGGRNMVFASVSGPPFFRIGRRTA